MLDIRSSSETAGIGRHRTERRDNDKYEFHSPLPIQKAIAARSLADELGAHTDEHREASCRQIRFIGTSMLASRLWGRHSRPASFQDDFAEGRNGFTPSPPALDRPLVASFPL